MFVKKPILLVEDDLTDANAAKRAVHELDEQREIVHVTNGEEAWEYLRRDDHQDPFLILLDLNMPRMNGLEFLGLMKKDPKLTCIPIVVLTTSSDCQDIDRSFGASVAGYVIKPIDYKDFQRKMRVIEQYWELNRLPGQVWGLQHAGN